MNSEEWMIFDGSNEYGPFDLNQVNEFIAEGRILPNTHLWKSGMDSWLEASNVEDFSGSFDHGCIPHREISMPPPVISKPRLMTPPVHIVGNGNVAWQTAGAKIHAINVGMSRKDYIHREIIEIFAMVMTVAFPFLMGIEPVPIIGIIVILATTSVFILLAKINRLSNIGWNSWLIALYFVPIVNLCALILDLAIFAAPADFAKTKRMDTAGWVLLVIYPFTILLKIALLMLMIVGKFPL
jgi:hypothetical protein